MFYFNLTLNLPEWFTGDLVDLKKLVVRSVNSNNKPSSHNGPGGAQDMDQVWKVLWMCILSNIGVNPVVMFQSYRSQWGKLSTVSYLIRFAPLWLKSVFKTPKQQQQKCSSWDFINGTSGLHQGNYIIYNYIIYNYIIQMMAPTYALPLETAERAFTWKSSFMEFWLSILVCPYVTLGNLLPPSG